MYKLQIDLSVTAKQLTHSRYFIYKSFFSKLLISWGYKPFEYRLFI